MIHIFIVNPYAGQKNFTGALRERLAKIEGLQYFVFNTRYAGDEADLVKRIQRIFEGEKLRFYCCGGSGTMRNMLNGFGQLTDVETAFFPCGLTNDFLKVFGAEEARFYDIEELIYGDVISIDYIRTNQGVTLNTFSIGLDANLVHQLEKYRMLGNFNQKLPYILALLYSMFVSKPQEYEVYLDEEKQEGAFSEIYLGNGYMLGGSLCMTQPGRIDDGKGSWMVSGNRRGFALIPILDCLLQRKHDKLKHYASLGSATKIRICKKDKMPFYTNQDGELVQGESVWEAQMVKQGLRFVVPKGVKL